MIFMVVLISIIVLGCGYLFYGRFLSKMAQLDDSIQTPACKLNDGVDYVPAKVSLLLGQHFSAIAAAGPIVGPILAGLWFGWLPALLWILLGAIFVGGVHDFTSLVASVKHKAASIGEIIKEYMSPFSKILFLIFVFFALEYVIIAFTDITAQTFKAIQKETAFGPAVAFSSFLYLLIGVFMGITLYKLKVRLWIATIIFIPLVLLVIYSGTKLPESIVVQMLNIPVKTYEVIILLYCFIASLIPMWLLLQPRGYLGGWFLYITILIALLGAFFGGFTIQYPAFNLEGFRSMLNMKLLFPVLFITVACGACSGFHGIVSSGTTSKQIAKESDAKPVGYGSMLLEAIVAVLALVTIMILPQGDALLKQDPNFIYASGLSQYLGMIGINVTIALTFALLAFSTFVYDTLDVTTRLARYIVQEIFNWKSRCGAVIATFLSLLLPLIFLLVTKEKGYIVAWPIFGTSNQLLASLTLLAISVWLIKTGKNAVYTIIPMIFMLVITLWSLILQIMPFIKSIYKGECVTPDVTISGICGITLFILSLWLIYEALNILILKRSLYLTKKG